MTLQEHPTRILIIDDDEDDFFIVSDFIKSIETGNFKIDWCYAYKDAIRIIGERSHDLYFVDYRLGAKTGLDLLKDAVALKCEEPIILLTGKGNPEVDREAMRIGAMDYLIKSDLNTEKLERCIRYSLERSATIKALRASEQKYRSIFESSKDAVFITDPTLRFIDVNAAASELLSDSKEKLLELSVYDLIEGEALKNRIRESLETVGEIIDLEIVILDHQNEKKICILTASKQIEDNGQVNFQGIIHDITNIKKAEKATLYAEKLAAAGRLVSTLAHEVRNPLNNIQMSVEHLDAPEVNVDDKMFFEIIKRNVRRINDLIGELLDSYRPTEKAFRAINLHRVVDDSVMVASDRTVLQGIKIEVACMDQPSIILADEEKLKIALVNILVNATEAIQATEREGRIKVSLWQKDNFYKVEIADNGCGIPPEILSKLFEPYFTSKRNGMGLGLASTLNIIQSHNGTIDVRSQVNVGTTFTITFPLVSSLPTEVLQAGFSDTA